MHFDRNKIRLEWGGQFENQRRAEARLLVILGLVMGMMLIFLTVGIKSFRQALLILGVVPLATLGGLISLHLTGQNLNVASGVGFIALFGVAVQNGIIMVSNLNRMRKSGLDLHEAIMQGATERLRPVLMTATVATLGMLPAAHPYRRRQRRSARHRDRGGRRPRNFHHTHAVRTALDVSRHRALGRAAPRTGAVGPMSFPRAMAVAAAVALGLTACAVGPNYQRPAPPADSGYGTAPSAGATHAAEGPAGDAQQFVAGMDIPAEWWTLFQSPPLDLLIERALKGNPDVASRAGGAQTGARAVSRAEDRFLPQRAGKLRRGSLRVSGGHADRARRTRRIRPTACTPRSSP